MAANENVTRIGTVPSGQPYVERCNVRPKNGLERDVPRWKVLVVIALAFVPGQQFKILLKAHADSRAYFRSVLSAHSSPKTKRLAVRATPSLAAPRSSRTVRTGTRASSTLDVLNRAWMSSIDRMR